MLKPRALQWLLILCSILVTARLGSTALAQGDCSQGLPPRLAVGQPGQVLYVDGQPLNVRRSASRSAAIAGQIPEGGQFDVLEGPTCADGIYWWRLKTATITGWAAEGADGKYFVGPLDSAANPTGSAPVVATAAPGTVSFGSWNWRQWYGDVPDPLALKLPAAYAGKLPSLPVNTDQVLFVRDSQLTSDQLALLKKNGFVVVPAGLSQFDDAYNELQQPMYPPSDPNAGTTSDQIGRPHFVTTDAMLFALHYVFDNLLTDLEKDALIVQMQSVVSSSYTAAQQQAKETAGTPLEKPARDAMVYLAVAGALFSPADKQPGGIPPEAQPLIRAAIDATGQLAIPFLKDYNEDFSQYRPRGHYADDPQLEQYFRGMMWISRITFQANDDASTLTALMLLRVLRKGDYAAWQRTHETLTFLIGPIDDLGPIEYGALADKIYGSDLSPKSLQDSTKLASFRAEVAKLPGPRVNGLVLPQDTKDPVNVGRGFRFMGQRFTFDAYVMQQLIYPYVGDEQTQRALPLGLDVPAVMGSDLAYGLAKQAGAAGYPNYDKQVGALRGELGALSAEKWLENIYGGWFWTLQPLWKREAKPYPPLMQTDAWLRKDLQTGLASWTELKHDTILYVKQPTGFGGGGPPLYEYGYVEPNPLVFARIAVVAALTRQGLDQRGWKDDDSSHPALQADIMELRNLATKAARFADSARKELIGQQLSEDEYFEIELFGTYLNVLLRTLYQGEGNPKPVALIADVASNTTINQVLFEAVGGVDFIYVVIPGPKGLQLARGGVFSYYEFTGDINHRLTDDEWRSQVISRKLPPRPDWVKAFVSGEEPPPAANSQ